MVAGGCRGDPGHGEQRPRVPLVALPQNDLLTVNGDELPPVKDSLGPGVDAGANVNFTEEGALHSIVDAVSIQYLVDRSVRDGIRGIRYINGSAAVVAGDN
ncbi:hypothetical protein ACH41E_24170 [Streptomyces sp. NPDC020412]|uniref:hypothetical protein n=1 Tax=Streptomyces sp. NPDC020412 TaxID=3365073 RepID=UPI0037BD05AC